VSAQHPVRRGMSTERKVLGGLALAVVCVAAIGSVSYWSVLRYEENSNRVARTDEVIGRLQLLLSTATDAETA